MPKVDPAKAEDKLVGVDNDAEIKPSFREVLRGLFKPHDTVRVQNIDDSAVEWQYLEEDKETFVIEDDSNIKIVTRETPDLWRIEPGEIDILDGACAYKMLEVLFKQMAVKSKGTNPHPLDERDINNFEFDDPEAWKRFIKRAYLGKLTPQMMKEAALKGLGENEDKPVSQRTQPRGNSEAKAAEVAGQKSQRQTAAA